MKDNCITKLQKLYIYAVSKPEEKKDIDISVLRIMKFATVHMDLALCIFRL